MDPWWTQQQAGLVGGIGGSVVGIVGGLVGAMAGWVNRGKCKPLVVGVFGLAIAGSSTVLIAGLAALALHQPWHVCYPLVQVGCSIFLFVPFAFMYQGRYRQAEMRHLEAEEMRRG
jgi:hypothetical protein